VSQETSGQPSLDDFFGRAELSPTSKSVLSPAQRIRQHQHDQVGAQSESGCRLETEEDIFSSSEEEDDEPWKPGERALYTKGSRSEQVLILQLIKGGEKCVLQTPDGREVKGSTKRLSRLETSKRPKGPEKTAPVAPPKDPAQDEPSLPEIMNNAIEPKTEIEVENDLEDLLGLNLAHEEKKTNILNLYEENLTKSTMGSSVVASDLEGLF